MGGAGAAPAFSEPLSPWIVGLVPAAALAWCLALGLRGGLVAGAVRRPGAAAVSAVVIVALLTPHYTFAGGGANYLRYYRWVLTDSLGSSVAVLDGTGSVLRYTRYKPFGGIDADYAPDTTRTGTSRGTCGRRRRGWSTCGARVILRHDRYGGNPSKGGLGPHWNVEVYPAGSHGQEPLPGRGHVLYE